MAQTVKYPIGIQDFEKLRSEGFLYVDKTGIIRNLVNQGSYYFLSRPRRFGKSLLLSTLQAYFEGNPELQDEFRSTLKAFYGALKSMDGCIRFAFLTGVTKFGKVSVFSDLNHLTDISMDARYWNICGITEEETRNIDGVVIG